MATHRVLALDGGGIRGLLTVALLRRLCEQPGLAGFLDSVDLVAGTSSGGLIALALAHGLQSSSTLETLRKIEQVFVDGRVTFGGDYPKFLGGQIFWPRFGTAARAKSFRSALGDATLGDLQTHVLITTFDLDDEGGGPDRGADTRRWRPKIFHNFAGVNTDREQPAWKVALYTTAGPTYFPTADGYVDGGVYSNNPSMCALAQLFDPRYPPNPKLDDVVLLSVGAGLNLKHITGKNRRWGIAQWGLKLVRIVGDGTVGIADYQCHRILGDRRYRRVEPTFKPGVTIEIDDLHRIDQIAEIAEMLPIDEDVAWIRANWMPPTNDAAARASDPAAASANPAPRPTAVLLSSSESGPIERDVSCDGRMNSAFFWVLTHLKWLWTFVQSYAVLQRIANAFLINHAIKYAAARPNPLSTMSAYTSWASLTDRTFYGRHLPPAEPGQRPSANTVADLFERPPDGFRESRKSTALFGYFAQWFIDGVVRTDFNLYPERTLKNTSSHDIDLCNVYGRTELQTAFLREGHDGRLKSQCIRGEEFPPFYYRHDTDGKRMLDSSGELIPAFDASLAPLLSSRRMPPLDRRELLFAMGGERANITPGYAMMNVLFLREHNRIADRLKHAHRNWDDERLFQTARNVLIVLVLKIVVEDYINHIAPYHFKFTLSPGRRINKAWHRPNWVSIEFNLLYRWHCLMPDVVDFVNDAVKVADCAYRNDLLIGHGLARAFEGATRQKSGEMGLFNTPPFLVREAELPSLDMSRRASLRSYNDYREWCKFPRVTSVDQISKVPAVRRGLRSTYGHVDEIELYTGLFAEDLRPNSALGPLMGRMVGIDAFSQALTNPLIAETVYGEKTFSTDGLAIIEHTRTLNDVVARNVTNASPVSFTHHSFKRI